MTKTLEMTSLQSVEAKCLDMLESSREKIGIGSFEEDSAGSNGPLPSTTPIALSIRRRMDWPPDSLAIDTSEGGL